MNLTYKTVENSKNTFGEGGNNPAGGSGQLTQLQIRNLCELAYYMGCNYFMIHPPMDTDAELSLYYSGYAANYNLFTVAEYIQVWADEIHAANMNAVHRGTWSGIKGNNSFPYVTYGGPNFVPLGTVAGASGEARTTYCGKMYDYLANTVGNSHFQTGDGFMPVSEFTEFLSSDGGFNTAITIASPAVLTRTSDGSAHELAVNDTVTFTTSGALPTGITTGVTYYVISAGLTSTEFRISTSQGGSAVNTSGTQSGTHYIPFKYQWFPAALSGINAGFTAFFTAMKGVVDAYGTANSKTFDYHSIANYSEWVNGYIGTTLPAAQGEICVDYYGHRNYDNGENVSPSAYVTDWLALKTAVGNGAYPIYQTELGGIFGDSWPTLGSTPATLSPRITNYEEAANFQIQLLKAYRDSIIAPGYMNGISNWGFWSGQNSSIVRYTNGTYYLNYMGQIYSRFIKGNGMTRVPVPKGGSFTSDAWGGRNIYF